MRVSTVKNLNWFPLPYPGYKAAYWPRPAAFPTTRTPVRWRGWLRTRVWPASVPSTREITTPASLCKGVTPSNPMHQRLEINNWTNFRRSLRLVRELLDTCDIHIGTYTTSKRHGKSKIKNIYSKVHSIWFGYFGIVRKVRKSFVWHCLLRTLAFVLVTAI